MALPAAAVWEIRADATANNVNGGGFNSARGGTDYTQQTAAQVNGTDGTSNASTNFNSAGVTFTSQMVGNYLHLTAGTNGTVGWYEIVAFVDANNVTLDRNCSTGAMTNGTFYVGGAMSMNSTLDDDMFEAAVAGNTFYLRGDAGTLSLGEAVNVSAAGSATANINIIGYDVTRGDTPNEADRPLIAGGANGFQFSGTAWNHFNIRFTTTSAAGYTITSNSINRNLSVINSSTTANRDGFACGGARTVMIDCDSVSYRGDALGISTGTVWALGCWFHDSNRGIDLSFGTLTLMKSIVSSNVVGAIVFSANTSTTQNFYLNNTLFGSTNTTGTGISVVTGYPDHVALNNIITGFVTGASHADTGTTIQSDFNDFYNDDTDRSNWPTGASDVDIDPAFTNVGQVTGTTAIFAAGNDRLIDTSKDFTALGVVALRDHLYIVSGTGATAGIYGITSITTTTNANDTLILTPAPGTNTTGDKVYQITTGQDFSITGSI